MRTKWGALVVAAAAIAGGVLAQTDRAEAAVPRVVVESLSVSATPDGRSRATAEVRSTRTVRLQALAVAVRSERGGRYDFPGAAATTLGTRSTTYTSGSRTFPAGTYTYFVVYKFHDRWHSLSPVKSFTTGTTGTTATPAASTPASTATPPAPPSPTSPAASTPAATPTRPAPPAAAAMPVGIGGTWRRVFSDEFNGSRLDGSKWNANWFGCPGCVTKPVNSAEASAYSPSQARVRRGALHLKLVEQPTTVDGTTYPYVSGLVNSNGKAQFTYGAFEARINTPSVGSQMANWPAFWTDGQNWPTDGEMDILEGLGGSACYHFHSPAGGLGGCVPGTYSGGWHTFGAEWKPGSVTYYYDGKQVGQITSGITSAPMYLILNNGINLGHSATNVAPADMMVDYVRVWQR
ncbi:family 16 glycosylhydrolase [Streptomyces sp. NPDC058751]|uniref:glycoside hydrolase family 16 protein n=1 Tax=Streptomyces sp. NPDC058751 TaxID=3346623 RepID=UPI0036CF8D5D